MGKRERVAVTTADIIGSSLYDTRDRRRLDRALKGAFHDVERRFPNAIHTKMAFRVTAGDEFQWVMSDVGSSVDALTYFRAVVVGAELMPPVVFRASIGVGDIAVSTRRNPYEEDGSAFARSRLGLESMGRSRQPLRWTRLITGTSRDDAAADAVLCLMDFVMQGWTKKQWEAVRWSTLDLNREEVARKLHIAHQNVTKRLHAAGWLHFHFGAGFLRDILGARAHPRTDAKSERTSKQVQGD